MTNVETEVEVMETNADGTESCYDGVISSETKQHYFVKFCSDGEREMIFSKKTLVGGTSKKHPTDNPSIYRLILNTLQEAA